MLSGKKILNVSKKRKGWIFIISTIFLFILIFFFVFFEYKKESKSKEIDNTFFNQEIWIRDVKIFVAVADTSIERNRGLSGVPRLKDNQGMLFLFDKPGIYGFWMKNMNFDLDFIWIRNNKIVDITENVPAPDYSENLKTYFPSQIIDSVLEVNAGWAQKNKIKLGDEIKI